MAFRRIVSQDLIVGFHERVEHNPCVGWVLKLIDTPKGAYFVFRVTQPCKVQKQVVGKKSVSVDVKPGDCIGVPACATLEPVRALIGKLVQLEYTGKVASKRFPGKHISLYDVSVDDDAVMPEAV